jgi:hypothetical protein
MFQQPLQQAFQGISGTVSSVFGQAFKSSGTALHSVFAAPMTGLGSLMGGGGGGASASVMNKIPPLLNLIAGGMSQSST